LVGFEVADRGGGEGPVVYADASKMIAVITKLDSRNWLEK
jgi:hypothetical protein